MPKRGQSKRVHLKWFKMLCNENYQTNFEMDIRNRLYFRGNQSFSQPEFLLANDAADFARASFSHLSERSL
jgi:hypothetical protein